jgi:hypothetical protein
MADHGGGAGDLGVALMTAVGKWPVCLLVCAGQAILRTVSVGLGVISRLDARGHGHIADSGGAANAEQ